MFNNNAKRVYYRPRKSEVCFIEVQFFYLNQILEFQFEIPHEFILHYSYSVCKYARLTVSTLYVLQVLNYLGSFILF